MKEAGIDEAGRGPVIGPLVMAVCIADTQTLHDLKKLGVRDSKDLPVAARETLFEEIETRCTVRTVILSPALIDTHVKDPMSNLNVLEAETAKKLLEPGDYDEAIVDSPQKNTAAFNQHFAEVPGTVRCEIKADQNHVSVAAASIIAKVTRDHLIHQLQTQLGTQIGSGYPSDPKTKHYLAGADLSSPHIRKTWSTVEVIKQRREQRSLSDF